MFLHDHRHTSEGKMANFFSFGLSFVFFFLCYCSMKTNSLKPSCLLGRAIWNCFSLIPTVQMGFQRNHILHPTVKFQRHDRWTASFTLKPCQMAANNISFVDSLVTEGSEVSDNKNTVSWVTRLCFRIMLYCHKILIEHLSTCLKDLTHLNLCVCTIL